MSVLADSVALLSGCAMNSVHLPQNSRVRNKSNVQATFSHRAFRLRSVTLAQNFGEPGQYHPLPSLAYVKLIRYEFDKVFRTAHLNIGQKPAYVVNVRVDKLDFRSDNGLGSSNEITHVTSILSILDPRSGLVIDPISIHPYDAGGYIYGYWHAQRWDYCRRTIPLTAIFVAKVVDALREGRSIHDDSLGTAGATIFQHTDDEDIGEYGIKSLSKKEIEDITGYGRQQLHDFDKPW
jgi:hypothetical protein